MIHPSGKLWCFNLIVSQRKGKKRKTVPRTLSQSLWRGTPWASGLCWSSDLWRMTTLSPRTSPPWLESLCPPRLPALWPCNLKQKSARTLLHQTRAGTSALLLAHAAYSVEKQGGTWVVSLHFRPITIIFQTLKSHPTSSLSTNVLSWCML